MNQKGSFVISLDFELLWGVRDKKTIEQYGSNILGVHTAIPSMLELFNRYKTAATFSSVGFLFFENKAELLQNIPSVLPTYTNKKLSAYEGHFDLINEETKNYHFAWSLIQLIQQSKIHEIGTHTFCHYYCLEEGQTIEAFTHDLKMAQEVATSKGIQLTSLVFPRNQFNHEYLKVCDQLGIICVRSNEKSWLYEARNAKTESKWRRACRLIDAYINISGHHSVPAKSINKSLPLLLPASRFLRPYQPKLKMLDFLKLNRITSAMTHAAKNKEVYHLWWHPHNFGIHQTENFLFLEKILKHFQYLQEKYNMQSVTMTQLANQIINE
jgi:hypothetical protein